MNFFVYFFLELADPLDPPSVLVRQALADFFPKFSLRAGEAQTSASSGVLAASGAGREGAWVLGQIAPQDVLQFRHSFVLSH